MRGVQTPAAVTARTLSPVDIERRIMELTADLEAASETYDDLTVEAAQAEADWKRLFHECVLSVALDPNRPKDATGREAQAHKLARDRRMIASALNRPLESIPTDPDLYAVRLITEARVTAMKEHLSMLRAVLDAQRTLSANLRVQV